MLPPAQTSARAWPFAAAALLGLLGAAVNVLRIPILTPETPLFVLGGAFVLLAFARYGAGPGLLAAVVSLSPAPAIDGLAGSTVVVYVVEAFVAWWLWRRWSSLVFAVTAFWLGAGWALDLLVYGAILGLGREYLELLYLKQVLNGILSAILAEALLQLPWGRGGAPASSLARYISRRVGLLVSLPALIAALAVTRGAYESLTRLAQARLEAAAASAAHALAARGTWPGDTTALVELLAAARNEDGQLLTLFGPDARVVASLDPAWAAGSSLLDRIPGAMTTREVFYVPPPDGSAESRLGVNRRHAAIRPVPGGILTAELPARRLHAAMAPVAIETLGVFLLIQLLLYLVVSRFTAGVAGPLQTLSDAANDMAAGRFPPLPAVAGLAASPIVEVRTVGGHFARLAQAVADNASRATASLRDSEGRFEALLDEVSAGVMLCAPDGQLLRANTAACRILGADEEQLRRHGLKQWDVTDDQGRPIPRDEYPVLVAARTAQRVAPRLISLSPVVPGERLWLLVSADPQLGPSGAVAQVIAVLTDVSQLRRADTERARAEEALRQSERRFVTAFRASPAAMSISTQSDGRYLLVNASFLNLIGYSEEEVIGHTGLELGYWQNPAQRHQLLEKLGRGESPRDVEVSIRRKSGELRQVLLSVETIDLDGQKCLLGLSHDITERKRAEERIEYQAYHDALTGLPNRTLLRDRLALALVHAQRNKGQLALMFVDLDHFKLINDMLGHEVGDRVLQAVAERLRGCVRLDDTVARMGGDEFTLLLPGLHREQDAAHMAQKVLDALGQPLEIEGQEISITASLGIGFFPDDGADADELLRNADAAMYKAKESGRSTYQLCAPGMNQRVLERMELERDLRRAQDRDELRILYQPILALATGRIVGVEALLRWQHPRRGLLEPRAFVSIAEDSRLIIPIGQWVLRTACRQLKAWHNAGLKPLRVAVNISARQFQQPDLAETIGAALGEAGLAAECLELEITESVAMHNAAWTSAVMHGLRAMGVQIAIDDFGTGQSSLSYLRAFPLSTLKVDRSFTADLPLDADNEAIVRSVIALGHSLRLKVVAEGVENEAQLELLRGERCEEAQGYLFGPPQLPEELWETLGSGRVWM